MWPERRATTEGEWKQEKCQIPPPWDFSLASLNEVLLTSTSGNTLLLDGATILGFPLKEAIFFLFQNTYTSIVAGLQSGKLRSHSVFVVYSQ